jgi:hypothetical protein
VALRPFRPTAAPAPALHERALADLRFIRQTMEQTATFTAFSGGSLLVIGATAILAAVIAPSDPAMPGWLATWLGEAALALTIGVTGTLRKTVAAGEPLWSGPALKFAFGVAPSLVVGALLTSALARERATLLPALWLLLYGAGLIAGGLFSLRVVPAVGVAFMALGVLALIGPAGWWNVLLAVGFGGLHAVFGVIVASKYGG